MIGKILMNLESILPRGEAELVLLDELRNNLTEDTKRQRPSGA